MLSSFYIDKNEDPTSSFPIVDNEKGGRLIILAGFIRPRSRVTKINFRFIVYVDKGKYWKPF